MTPKGHLITRGQVSVLLFLIKAKYMGAVVDYTCLLTPLDVEGNPLYPNKSPHLSRLQKQSVNLFKVFDCINRPSIFLCNIEKH